MIRERSSVRAAATVPRSAKRGSIIALACLSLVALAATAISSAADHSKTYPEKGKVVAANMTERTTYVPVSPPDSKGRSGGGEAFVGKTWVYRVETDDRSCEFEGGKKQSLRTGDDVEFRIEKDSVHVRAGAKDVKYRLVSNIAKPVASAVATEAN
jgi:hypothetical protein